MPMYVPRILVNMMVNVSAEVTRTLVSVQTDSQDLIVREVSAYDTGTHNNITFRINQLVKYILLSNLNY